MTSNFKFDVLTNIMLVVLNNQHCCETFMSTFHVIILVITKFRFEISNRILRKHIQCDVKIQFAKFQFIMSKFRIVVSK